MQCDTGYFAGLAHELRRYFFRYNNCTVAEVPHLEHFFRSCELSVTVSLARPACSGGATARVGHLYWLTTSDDKCVRAYGYNQDLIVGPLALCSRTLSFENVH